MTNTRTLLLATVLLGLPACAEQGGQGNDVAIMNQAAEPARDVRAPQPVPEPGPVPADWDRPANPPPPASDSAAAPGRFQWTGRYAASAEMCRNNQDWRFTNASVETAGETSCRINHVQEVGDQVRLDLSCMAEGMASQERWTLQPADGDQIRLRREGSGAPQELYLRFCG